MVTLTARSHRPIQAYTRRWPLFKRVHPILATYLPIDYPFSIPLLDCGRAIRSVAHTRKHTHTDPRSNVLPASGGVFSRPMHHTHTHVWRNLWGNHARGAFDRKYLVRGLFAHPASARARAHTHTEQSPLSKHSTTMGDTRKGASVSVCGSMFIYAILVIFYFPRNPRIVSDQPDAAHIITGGGR